jgi:hypothetical protein
MELSGRNKLLIARIGLAVNMLNKKSAVAAKLQLAVWLLALPHT